MTDSEFNLLFNECDAYEDACAFRACVDSAPVCLARAAVKSVHVRPRLRLVVAHLPIMPDPTWSTPRLTRGPPVRKAA